MVLFFILNNLLRFLKIFIPTTRWFVSLLISIFTKNIIGIIWSIGKWYFRTFLCLWSKILNFSFKINMRLFILSWNIFLISLIKMGKMNFLSLLKKLSVRRIGGKRFWIYIFLSLLKRCSIKGISRKGLRIIIILFLFKKLSIRRKSRKRLKIKNFLFFRNIIMLYIDLCLVQKISSN